MDETRNPSETPDAEPDADPSPTPGDAGTSADPLVRTVAELRGQIDVIAPSDQRKGREALERSRGMQERIATLEAMLTSAREREEALTTEAVRARARILEADARIFELSSVAARVTAAEAARREADAIARGHERVAALAKDEAKAAEAEIALLRSRTAELEEDLASIADDLAAATVARAEATRLERERNEARERAHVERRLAAEDRLRAAEADLRAADLQARLRDAEHRILLLDEGRLAVSTATGEATDREPEPSVVSLDEAPSETQAAAAVSEAEETSPPDVPGGRSARPLWSASGPAASIARTADPWAPSQPSMRASTTPSLAEADPRKSTEPGVVDLTGQEDEEQASEEPTEEETGPD